MLKVKNLAHSFVSAVTLLGNPVEVYFYGQQYTMIVFAFVPMTILLSYFYVPVYLDLQLNSAYQVRPMHVKLISQTYFVKLYSQFFSILNGDLAAMCV